jgi:hypothetical protein
MKNQTKKLLYLFSIISLCIFTVYLGYKLIHNIKILLWPDSIGYLQAASDALETGVFTHVGYRSFVYPLVLYLALLVGESPLNIVYVQLIMAYLGILIVLCIGIIVIGKITGQEKYSLSKLLGVTLFVCLLCAYRPVWNLAQAIMPETLASLLLAFWCLAVVVLFYSTKIFVRYVAMFVSMSIASIIYLVKPHFILVSIIVPFMILLLSAIIFNADRQLSIFKSSIIYAASLVILLTFYQTESNLKARFEVSHSSQLFGARSIFCNNANIVINNKNPEQLIPGLYSALELTVNKPSGFVIQRFDGDNCMYGAAGTIVQKYFEGQPSREVEYYLKNYFESVLNSPELLFYRVYRQSKYLIMHLWVDGDEILGAGDAVLKGHISYRRLYDTWYENYRTLFQGPIYAPALISFNVISSATGALIIIASIICVYSLVGRKRISKTHCAFITTIFLFLLTNILIAIVHTFDNARYITVQWPIVATLTLLSFATCLDALRDSNKYLRK